MRFSWTTCTVVCKMVRLMLPFVTSLQEEYKTVAYYVYDAMCWVSWDAMIFCNNFMPPM